MNPEPIPHRVDPMIIATRVLTLRRKRGDIKVPIRVHAPEKDKRLAWKCRFSSKWPNRTYKFEGYGDDAMQALVLTLKMISALLYASKEHKSGQLFWSEPGSGYGLPVMKNMRRYLVGLDKQFE